MGKSSSRNVSEEWMQWMQDQSKSIAGLSRLENATVGALEQSKSKFKFQFQFLSMRCLGAVLDCGSDQITPKYPQLEPYPVRLWTVQ